MCLSIPDSIVDRVACKDSKRCCWQAIWLFTAAAVRVAVTITLLLCQAGSSWAKTHKQVGPAAGYYPRLPEGIIRVPTRANACALATGHPAIRWGRAIKPATATTATLQARYKVVEHHETDSRFRFRPQRYLTALDVFSSCACRPRKPHKTTFVHLPSTYTRQPAVLQAAGACKPVKPQKNPVQPGTTRAHCMFQQQQTAARTQLRAHQICPRRICWSITSASNCPGSRCTPGLNTLYADASPSFLRPRCVKIVTMMASRM